MNYPFATSKEAADIAGITPADIGVAANHWPTKRELVGTGKFDASSLSAYQDREFVLLKDLSKGAFTISASLNSDVANRGSIKINNGTPGNPVSVEVNVGDSVTVQCHMSNANDVFDGWYNGATRVSTDATYTFTADSSVDLVAKFFFLDVSPTTLSYDSNGGTKTVTVSTNVPNWTVS